MSRVLSVALLLGAGLIGCSEDTTVGYGDLRLEYRVGSGRDTCAERGIRFVRVSLVSPQSPDIIDETFSCKGDDQSVVLTAVAQGSYSVRVDALDDDYAVIYQGETSTPVTIEADTTNGPVNVVLTQLRPGLQLWFGFAEPGGCERFQVSNIAVVIYENGRSVIYEQSFPCSSQLAEPLTVENLSETSTYDLRVRGTNENDEATYQFNQDGIAVEPGAATEVSVTLTQCSGICPRA